MDFFNDFPIILSCLGFILVVFAFKRDYKKLSDFQKFALIVICIGAIGPFLLDTMRILFSN